MVVMTAMAVLIIVPTIVMPRHHVICKQQIIQDWLALHSFHAKRQEWVMQDCFVLQQDLLLFSRYVSLRMHKMVVMVRQNQSVLH